MQSELIIAQGYGNMLVALGFGLEIMLNVQPLIIMVTFFSLIIMTTILSIILNQQTKVLKPKFTNAKLLLHYIIYLKVAKTNLFCKSYKGIWKSFVLLNKDWSLFIQFHSFHQCFVRVLVVLLFNYASTMYHVHVSCKARNDKTT